MNICIYTILLTCMIYIVIYDPVESSTWKSFPMTLWFGSENLLVFTSRVLAIAHKTANVMAYSISGTLE